MSLSRLGSYLHLSKDGVAKEGKKIEQTHCVTVETLYSVALIHY